MEMLAETCCSLFVRGVVLSPKPDVTNTNLLRLIRGRPRANRNSVVNYIIQKRSALTKTIKRIPCSPLIFVAHRPGNSYTPGVRSFPVTVCQLLVTTSTNHMVAVYIIYHNSLPYTDNIWCLS